ncbi:PLP-dependent transferase, partial [Pyrenochaeta sp. DS3sAY3a]
SYDKESNPGGVVNLGTGENYTMLEDVAAFLNSGLKLHHRNIEYGEGPWGTLRLRTAMAAHMTKWLHALEPVTSDEVLFTAGCTSLCEMLGFTLFEEGDGILLSRPIYQAFRGDFGVRAKVEPVFVPSQGLDLFGVDGIKAYEDALVESEKAGVQIKAILICNPHNPLGQCYTKEALIGYMQFAQKHKIHLLMDEIYALSEYDVSESPEEEPTRFISVLAIESKQYIEPTYLHILYGLSKDFACGGFRLGCLWSRNEPLRTAVGGLSPFSWPSTISEAAAVSILENQPWLENFMHTNRKRLTRTSDFARKALQEYGIAYEAATSAGFFLWIDVRKFLRSNIDDVTWEDEQRLRLLMKEHRIYLTCGEDLMAEKPGFFRFCFAKEEEEIRLGLER